MLDWFLSTDEIEKNHFFPLLQFIVHFPKSSSHLKLVNFLWQGSSIARSPDFHRGHIRYGRKRKYFKVFFLHIYELPNVCIGSVFYVLISINVLSICKML